MLLHQLHEQVRLRLPLSARSIHQAVAAFKAQFSPTCYLYVQGHVTVMVNFALHWRRLSIARSEPLHDISEPFHCTLPISLAVGPRNGPRGLPVVMST